MVLCLANEKTTIKWQYPGETEQQIIGADDYSIEPVYATGVRYQWQYEISNAILSYSGTNLTDPSLACGGVTGIHRQCVGYPRRTWDSGFDAARTVSVVYAPIYQYRVTDFHQSDYPCVSYREFPCTYPYGYRVIQLLCHGGAIWSNVPVWITIYDMKRSTSANGGMLQNTIGGNFNMVYDSAIDQYKFLSGQQSDWSYFRFTNFDNKPPTSCSFKVLKNSGVVYQKTKPTAPVVTYSCGEQCPPGTCECDCGNMVCCYDTTTGRAVKSFAK